MLDKFTGKDESRKVRKKELEKKICFTANLTVCLQMHSVQNFAISFWIQLLQYMQWQCNLLSVQVTEKRNTGIKKEAWKNIS